MNSKGLITKNLVCKECSNTFDSDRSNKKFCSKLCYTNWSKGKLAYPNLVGKRGIKPRTWHLRNDKRNLHAGIEYQNWRNKVYKRDNYTCQECGKRGIRLNADHIKPFSKYPELRYELTNGRTLCIGCHKKTDSYGWQNYWKNYIAEERLSKTTPPLF